MLGKIIGIARRCPSKVALSGEIVAMSIEEIVFEAEERMEKSIALLTDRKSVV